jgi:hypothetical protein
MFSEFCNKRVYDISEYSFSSQFEDNIELMTSKIKENIKKIDYNETDLKVLIKFDETEYIFRNFMGRDDIVIYFDYLFYIIEYFEDLEVINFEKPHKNLELLNKPPKLKIFFTNCSSNLDTTKFKDVLVISGANQDKNVIEIYKNRSKNYQYFTNFNIDIKLRSKILENIEKIFDLKYGIKKIGADDHMKNSSFLLNPMCLSNKLCEFLKIIQGSKLSINEVIQQIKELSRTNNLISDYDPMKIDLTKPGGEILAELINVERQTQINFFNLKCYIMHHFIQDEHDSSIKSEYITDFV